MKVLIAEDDVGTAYALQRLLGGWGFETHTVAHAAEAWAVLDGREPPPMAIVEQALVGGSGIELCRRLRQPERKGYTYVIMIGALEEEALVQQVVEAGANDFLAKPFEIGELRRSLMAGRQLLEAMREHGRPDHPAPELRARRALARVRALTRPSMVPALRETPAGAEE